MVWWKNPCFLCFYVWEIFIKKKISIALQLHVFALPKPYDWSSWYKPLHICALLLHWASSNFVTLVRCLSYMFDQDHVHSTSWTSTLKVSYAIPSIHKINSMFNDLSLVSFKWGMGYQKKERKRKDGIPQKHDPKKWTHQCPWKKRGKKKYIYI